MFKMARFRFLIIIAAVILIEGVFTDSAKADAVTLQIITLNGTIHPITYTTSQGTFTTSPITLTLSSSSASFFTVDQTTGLITAHTVMDISFNNGQPGTLNANLLGVVTVDESGVLGPLPIIMHIDSGVLSGAGEFANTIIFGDNPIVRFFSGDDKGGCEAHWDMSPPDSPPVAFINLPPNFVNGTNIPIHGEIDCDCTPTPEPTTVLLLGTGVAGVAIKTRKRLKNRKSGRGSE